MISGDDIYEIREQKIEGATDTKWWWAKSTIEHHSPVIITEGNREIVIKYLAQLGYENTEPTSKSDYIFHRSSTNG